MTAYYRASKKMQEQLEEDTKDEKVKEYSKALHPVILQKYKDSGYLLDKWLPRAEQENAKNFWATVDKNGGKPVIHEIQQIYRLKNGMKEYFFYQEALRSEDKLGKPIHHFHTVGKYEDPNFKPTYHGDTAEIIGNEIDSIKTVYELEWPKDWTDKMEEQMTDNCNFIVIAKGNRKYGGFDFEDFLEKSLDELVLYGKYGTFSPKAIEEIEAKDLKRKLEKIK
jgi:hypothetical protein